MPTTKKRTFAHRQKSLAPKTIARRHDDAQPVTKNMDLHEVMLHHLAMGAILKGPHPQDATAPAESDNKAYARARCGWYLTVEDANFALDKPSDYDEPIDWNANNPNNVALDVNAAGPGKPEEKGFGDLGLQWNNIDPAGVKKAQTRGQLADILTAQYS